MPATQTASAKASARPAAKSRKLFYRIQDVAEITGLKPYVLRYWETQFKELSPQKDKSDQRRYRQSDIETIQKIKDLLYNQKFTIAGAKQRIKDERKSRRGTNGKQPARATLKSIRSELQDLMRQLSA